jgi:predicted GIY-YIG superfamily endonuclease
MVMSTYLYWIRLESHTDITSEGYVGITNDFTKRMLKHSRCDDGSEILYNAIKKYGWENLIKTIMLEGSEEYGLDMENKLRPSERIGWNIAIGGGKPPTKSGNDNPSRNPEVVAKRQKTRDLRTTPYEKIARGDNHPRRKNPELYAHLKGVKRDINAPKGDDHPRRKNPEKWNNLLGDNNPRRKNPEKWANAIGENHWTKSEEGRKKLTKGGNPNAKKIRCIETGEIFDSISTLCEKLNLKIVRNMASGIKKKQRRYGFHWEYVVS